MTARELVTRIEQVNQWFEYYAADDDYPERPFHKLDDDEIRKIYYWVLPSAWQRMMEENLQFNQMTAGLRGVVEYAERLKTLESRLDPCHAKRGDKINNEKQKKIQWIH